MKYIFLLSGDYIGLAKEEILSLFDAKEYELSGRLFIAGLSSGEKNLLRLSKRLALTKSICTFLFECKINELADFMKRFDWNSVYKDDFCLRAHFLDGIGNNTIKNNKIQKSKKATSKRIHAGSNPPEFISEKSLAKHVWYSVKNPKVNLENPKTRIELFIFGNKAYCGLLIFENNEDFESRKSHLRPFPSPSSLHPKIARALVNMTGIRENEVLLEPFCGAGGFLIESGLMGITSVGYDINRLMTDECKKNLRYFGIINSKINNKNALKIDGKFDCAATDLPYGLNSNVISEDYKGNWKLGRINKKIQKEGFIEDLEKFYLGFLKRLRKKLKKKAVIVFPSYVDYKKLLKKSKFRIEKEFSNYVHRSLTRKIVKIS
ncbi:hypothetical protein HYV80_01220 [Candidatus Woesearchaeota archaeon]|nr:hypothetical protein [Candidatus Woesearchaeota archaeon]